MVLLQELKCLEEEFPFEAIFDAGYNAVVYGQKTYNGVAILAKSKIEDVVKGLPNFKRDEQARYIEGVVSVNQKAIRVSSIYIPNGGGDLMPDEKLEDSKKFLYKLEFYNHLKSRLEDLLNYHEIQVFGGDFNVACEEIDVYDPKSFEGQILFHPLERQKFRSLLNLGLSDSFRANNPRNQSFSWWDYRGNGWQHNKGARIDYLLTSPLASDLLVCASIEAEGVRDQEKPSDHCPVCVTLKL